MSRDMIQTCQKRFKWETSIACNIIKVSASSRVLLFKRLSISGTLETVRVLQEIANFFFKIGVACYLMLYHL